MKEPYEIDVAPSGKVFVSQCGWGRRFDNMDDALAYINKMQELCAVELTSKSERATLVLEQVALV